MDAPEKNLKYITYPSCTVAHNCHGKTKSHGTTNFTHGKTKLTHGKTKFTHGKTKKTNWSAVVICEITKMQTFVKAVVEVRFLI